MLSRICFCHRPATGWIVSDPSFEITESLKRAILNLSQKCGRNEIFASVCGHNLCIYRTQEPAGDKALYGTICDEGHFLTLHERVVTEKVDPMTLNVLSSVCGEEDPEDPAVSPMVLTADGTFANLRYSTLIYSRTEHFDYSDKLLFAPSDMSLGGLVPTFRDMKEGDSISIPTGNGFAVYAKKFSTKTMSPYVDIYGFFEKGRSVQYVVATVTSGNMFLMADDSWMENEFYSQIQKVWGTVTQPEVMPSEWHHVPADAELIQFRDSVSDRNCSDDPEQSTDRFEGEVENYLVKAKKYSQIACIFGSGGVIQHIPDMVDTLKDDLVRLIAGLSPGKYIGAYGSRCCVFFEKSVADGVPYAFGILSEDGVVRIPSGSDLSSGADFYLSAQNIADADVEYELREQPDERDIEGIDNWRSVSGNRWKYSVLAEKSSLKTVLNLKKRLGL